MTGLGKRYRGGRDNTWALRDCSFTLPAGSVTALVGMNGAGKTTLLSILAGLLTPTAGHLTLPSTGQGGADGARIAFVAQEKPLYRYFSVADMLQVGARLNRVWDQERALRWLRRFDIPLDRACGRLSGGQQAQVNFAIALGSRPSVLLLDEPVSTLDPLARSEVTAELLTEAADTGMTVLLSTHVVGELVGVADHLLLLAKGRLLAAGEIDTLLENHLHYVGPRADVPPGPGQVVWASHTDNQSVFLVRLPETGPVPPVDAPWTTRPVTLEEFVLAQLKKVRTAGEGEA
ncbi:ABC transporter ATP-binding protein [Goodfellowiella coeruleoviolacea]|uniref:ABC transporter ATP-binding protein n=1 Tax=Goodfellowiella coeruleoviolacea TaxID=334858 RepID=UPI000B313C9C|nr:ABC transporter ATP-binding protein [Goodfellowiella coeruleoviolacea]